MCGAQAQSVWSPTKNVEIVAPAGPASALDQTARAIQRTLEARKLTNAPLVVVNKPGGAQAIGFAYLIQHAADAHYLSIATISLLTNRITGVNAINYQDVTPLANLVAEHIVFAVRSESPIRGGKDLADRLRADPAGLSLAFSGAPGNHNHIAIGLFGKAAGGDVRKLKTVVFASGGELAAAGLGGHVDVVVGGSSVFASHVQAGRMRLLGVTSAKRLEGHLAGTPTFAEQGLNATFATFRGVAGPKGIPAGSVKYWEDVLQRVSTTDEWKSFLKASDSESFYLGSEAYARFLETENARVRAILTELGLAK